MSLILSGTDGLSDVDGTAATPAIRGTDANTGIFFPAADTIAFSEGGAEVARFDSSGNFGIGTNSPSTYGKLVVLGSGNSGVGVFVGNASLTGSNPTYQGSIRVIDNPTSSTTTSGGIEFLTSSFGSGYGWKMASIDSSGVQLTFATRQNTASWTEMMRLNNAGTLSLNSTGTSGNSEKLHIKAETLGTTAGNTAYWQSLFGPDVSNTTVYSIFNYRYANGSSHATSEMRIQRKVDATDQGYIGWRDQACFTTGYGTTEYARMDASGNLLVGTTSNLSGQKSISVAGASTNRGVCALGCTTNTTSGVAGSIQTFNGSTFIAGFDFQINATNSGSIQVFTVSAGTLVQGPFVGVGGTSWSTPSDETLKDIIAPIENATLKLSGLRTVFGKFKTDHDDVRRIFLIAQDVQSVFPEVISTDNNGKLGLSYQDLVPVLVAAIKEQQALITTLTARITALETK
jgi:hypothetical protein